MLRATLSQAEPSLPALEGSATGAGEIAWISEQETPNAAERRKARKLRLEIVLKARTGALFVAVALLALPLACGSVGRELSCGVSSTRPLPGLSVHLIEKPTIAEGHGQWCTVSRGSWHLVMGVLGSSSGSPLRTVVYLPDVVGVDAGTLRWIDRNLVRQGFQVVVGCYSNSFGPESLACPDAPDLTDAVTGVTMLLDTVASMPNSQPLGVIGVLQGGVAGLMAVAGRSDVRAFVDDSGSPGSLSLYGIGRGRAPTAPIAAAVLVLGPDSPAYDRTFEGSLRAGGTRLQDVTYLPTSNGPVMHDVGVGSRATRELLWFLDSLLG